jgi:hypothetical protein
MKIGKNYVVNEEEILSASKESLEKDKYFLRIRYMDHAQAPDVFHASDREMDEFLTNFNEYLTERNS